MCVPGCQESVARRLSRRRFAGVAMGAAAGMAAAPLWQGAARAAEPRSFTRVVDLTHVMGPDFPTYFGEPQLSIEVMASYAEQKFNMKRWTVVEHTGTHLDAPFHFSENGPTSEAIPVEDLVVPLAVIDIAARAQDDADAQVTPEDIEAFEAAHGPIPEGACVAMRSGWDRFVRDARFRNADGNGVMHFPGFHVEAAMMLIEQRKVAGIAVDTLSLDFGASPDFATHYAWLPTNRWGLECLANMAALPATGATLVVGAPMIEGATGGPSRVMALL